MWTKPCLRPGCTVPVTAACASHLADRAYCGPACRTADASRRARLRPARVYVPSPSNNLHHRRIADQQLALIRAELERIRLERRRSA